MIAQRTRKNLECIYRTKAEGEDVEEFTQLLNSMFGLVICMREDYYKGGHVSWQDITNLGLLATGPTLVSIAGKCASSRSPNLQQANSFSQLVTKMRHAFAHNCFDLNSDARTGKIIGVTLWNVTENQRNRPANRTWEVEITEEELKALAYLIVEYVEKKLA